MAHQGFINCRNHVNCGGYAEPKSEYCEECLEEQAEMEAERAEQRAAIADLKNALAFYDQVQCGSVNDAEHVEKDRFDWLEKAARKVVELN